MDKDLPSGHHLMRVRVKKGLFRRLSEAADEETEMLGEHVTVSDLVRAACVEYLDLRDTKREIENMPADTWEGEVRILLRRGSFTDP